MYKNPQSIYDICILTHDSIRTLTILDEFYVHILSVILNILKLR